ncbi:MAG: CRISPR-associated endonuclease Cas2 [Candidatus Nealsonbacteria bacterium CG08_land_8_20_14_0_20_43_11]|uniref:CRISPR-associated endonuclease Cas2 n=1 Tax=Candidatus Nealsonbacteria bacterium CG08_land_8_20_14_0_20_43_11 TaxID=1974706 RepID=A0A2M6T0D8_9BACT|nr:MAG: CRISPR-associated endonuclease Cas2 [Candidatus Nealsonbacteria bacterium CG08_land_8_20_14_0_20_43_11]
MRLPITDKFLLDLYAVIEGVDDIIDVLGRRSMKEAVYPELYRFRQRYEKKQDRKNFSNLINYLKRKGYIKSAGLRPQQGIAITKKGLEKIWKARLKGIERKIRKDRKWQMIIFDIPEEKRDLRSLLRENLQLLRYQMLQRSVWVCPYDVMKETEAVINRYLLDRYINNFLIEETFPHLFDDRQKGEEKKRRGNGAKIV